jgi:RNA 3'-terminal phosphate cyclase (ATP)
MLVQMGIAAQLKINRHGFYPMGGGELVLELPGGATLQLRDWTERGELVGIEGVAYVGNLPSHIPQRMADRAGALLQAEELPVTIEPRHIVAQGQGAAIFLLARYENGAAGFSSLGKKGVSSEAVAEAAVEELLDFHYGKGVLDPHLGDQMVLPLALAGGTAQAAVAAVTGHLQTNVWTVGQFPVAPLRVEGREGRAGLLFVESQHA